MEDILLDDDGNFVAAANGDMDTVSDRACLIQDVKHRLITFPGDLWTDKEYGVGIQWFINAEDSELNRLELRQRIKTGIAKDIRVESGSIGTQILSWDKDKISVQISFLPSSSALEEDGGISADRADIVLIISQEGVKFGG